MKSYEDLDVWQKSMLLSHDIYRLTEDFPDSEKFGLVSQMRRCAVSIPSNIAEGYGRGSRDDYRRFLYMVRGSVYELDTQARMAMMLNLINENDGVAIKGAIDRVGKMLNGLIRSL